MATAWERGGWLPCVRRLTWMSCWSWGSMHRMSRSLGSWNGSGIAFVAAHPTDLDSRPPRRYTPHPGEGTPHHQTLSQTDGQRPRWLAGPPALTGGTRMPRVVHFEIHAEDPERAARFYGGVFGWQINKWAGP